MHNRNQIEREAQRRANVMGKTYGIYQHELEGYCIHRPVENGEPAHGYWKLVNTIAPQVTA